MTTRVVIIEDDDQVRSLIEQELAFEGFSASAAGRAQHGLELVRRERPDLVLLDLNLPEASGFDLLRTLRQEGDDVPVIVVSAREREADKVRALTLGADDYLTKPFGLSELVAWVRAVLRRRGVGGQRELLALGILVLDRRRREVHVAGRAVGLTLKEFEILRLLLERPGEVVSRDRFLDTVWPDVFVSRRTIDTHVALLRQKLRAADGRAPAIDSVRGVGYKLVARED
jgi:DNA-binding response OmpR family regulator